MNDAYRFRFYPSVQNFNLANYSAGLQRVMRWIYFYDECHNGRFPSDSDITNILYSGIIIIV